MTTNRTTIISRTTDRRIGASPSKLYDLLLAAEVDSDRAPDMRRVLGVERQALGQALERVRDADAAIRQAQCHRYLNERVPAVQAAVRDRDRAVADMVETAAEARRTAEAWELEIE